MQQMQPIQRLVVTGRFARVLSMKLREAQKSPESALVSVVQRASALVSDSAPIHAQNSTLMPPAELPSQIWVPQRAESQRPRVNLRCSSRVLECLGFGRVSEGRGSGGRCRCRW